MRILLQHIRSQLYLKSSGQWTANPFEALDFRHSQSAIDFARDNSILDTQIAVTFLDSQFNEIIPLPPFHSAPRPPA